MAAMVQCVVITAASSRLQLGAPRPECSSSSHKAEFTTSSTRRKSFGGHKLVSQQQLSGGFGANQLPMERHPARWASICRRAGPPGDDEKATESGAKDGEGKATIEVIEKALGKAFGGPLWFGILLACLAIFGGGYVYLIYNYADFSDIPILNGPQRY